MFVFKIDKYISLNELQQRTELGINADSNL